MSERRPVNYTKIYPNIHSIHECNVLDLGEDTNVSIKCPVAATYEFVDTTALKCSFFSLEACASYNLTFSMVFATGNSDGQLSLTILDCAF